MHNFQATSHFPDKNQKNHLTVALENDHRPYAKFYIGSGIALHNQWIPDSFQNQNCHTPLSSEAAAPQAAPDR